MKDNRILEIVNDQGTVIGEGLRTVIHDKGLLHREVHVWLYTPNDEIIFQHRAKNKDTFPDLLASTAGGHVEKGDNWLNSAIKELKEETGIAAEPDELRFCFEDHTDTVDKQGMRNNTLRRTYGYLYTGKINELVVERGESLGFEIWSLENLLNLDTLNKKKFIPIFYTKKYLDLYKQLLSKN